MNALPKTRKAPRPVSVVVQTHWDREWYFPHQRFVARLLNVMTRVAAQLESGALKTFLFDGQTAAMEDLLEHAEPALADRMRKLVRDKRIFLGPWYVSADEFLVAGEALMRNLEIGIADATAAGNCQRIGYLPDTFGHIAQMPQILRGFGITSAVVWRGVDSPNAEFEWQSPDGSRVGTVFLTQGYYQHPFNVDDWQTALLRYLEQIEGRSLSDELLLTQGGDHLVPIDALADRIAAFNSGQNSYVLHQRSLAEHVQTALADTIDKRAVIRGELRDNAQAFVLPDVLSTRRYLKRLNQQAEDKLLGVIEPLLAQLDWSDGYPARYLEKCWRALIQQQAHDSICGCSVDQVHQEMLARFAQLDQRLEALLERITDTAGMTSATAKQEGGLLSVFADDRLFTLFNPLPKHFKGHVVCQLFLHGERRDGLSIQDSSGRALASEVLSVAPHANFRSPIDDFPDLIAGHLYEVAVHAEIDGLAPLACQATWLTGRHTDGKTDTKLRGLKTLEGIRVGQAIENAQLRVTLDEIGELTLQDKSSQVIRRRFISFFSELDAGDSYNFSPPRNQTTNLQSTFTLRNIVMREHVQEMTLHVTMTVPAQLSVDRVGAEPTCVVNEGELRLRLFAGSHALDCHLTWTNRAQDQRTRLLLPLLPTVTETFSDVAFDWVRRPIVFADYPEGISRREMPVAVNPTHSTVAVGDIIFCHRAMQEYEVICGEGALFFATTLVRSVGWMSRRDLVTRGVGAGPDMPTPEAQCLGTEVFEFRIALADGTDASFALIDGEQFRRPPVMLRGHSLKWRPAIDIGNVRVQVSAVRRVGDEREIRLWNPTNSTQQVATDHWRRVDADGSPSSLPATVIAPFAIATLRQNL